ncbi:hypothetical protein M8818_005576 [Zalaria obscura]|uniref:Uncharacterized protein n=1 Tax=Zalaria obscura TaxID=2024903 RepID=A0ACC3S9C0_9PEZI
MPFGANRPSILTDYKRRWTLEKERIKRMVIDLVAVLSVKYRFVKPRPDLQYFQVTKIAKGLYESMYEQFATGNLDPIRPRLCESIEENLTARIANRPKNTHLQWKLHRYIGRPALMSYRAGMMQLNDDNEKQTGITQAVVRIRSEQSLRRVKRVRAADGKVLEVLEEGSVMGANDGSKGKEVVEYFVIQRMIRNGVWGDWMIWGTTQESTVESVERARRRKLGLGDDE